MKALLMSLLLVSAYQISNGQTNKFPPDGAVGIGTVNPITKLHVYSNDQQGEVRIGGGNGIGEGRIFIQANMANNQSYIDAFGDNVFKRLSIEASPLLLNNDSHANVGVGTANPFATLHVRSELNTGTIAIGSDIYPALLYSSAVTGEFRIDNRSSFGGFISFYPNGQGTALGSEAMRISKLGNIGIGTTNPTEKLSVNGNIRAQEIKVETQNWPDYVFKANYALPSLAELKSYIDKNEHLPELPSAKQIADDGLNVGEMNKLLVKKIEELTLYLIEKDKQLKDQQTKINRQEERLDKFEAILIKK